jgi:hypothetical protein
MVMVIVGGIFGPEIIRTFRQEDLKVGSVTATVSVDSTWVGPYPPAMLAYLFDIDRGRNIADRTGLGRITMDAGGVLWSDCSGYVRVIVSPGLPTGWKVRWRDSCNQRFCPVCADSKNTKIARQKVAKVRRLLEKTDVSLLYITLRGRYCSWDGLRESVDHLHRSVRKFVCDERFPGTGASRYTDFTRYDEDTIRPHNHILVLVGKSYSKNPRRYLTKDEWRELWYESSGVSEPDAVKVQTLKDEDVFGEVFRRTKYSLTLLDDSWTGDDEDHWSTEEVQRLQRILKGVRVRQDYGDLLLRRKRPRKSGVSGRRRRS